MDNEFILFDRVEKIKSLINQEGEDKFYISFSGGKDSTVLSALVDMAIPNNKISRVFCNTGLEYREMYKFVKEKSTLDNRIILIAPYKNVIKTLKRVGYPFKSKEHAEYVLNFKTLGINSKTCQRYLYPSEKRKSWGCPKKLRYQFTGECKLSISDRCCYEFKEDILEKWAEDNKKIPIVGIRKDEGGRRNRATCLSVDKKGNIKKFKPLAPIKSNWINWFIKKYDIKLCKLYYPPYRLKRTGCVVCPNIIDLQKDLDNLYINFPNEYKKAIRIWKPVFDEYIRIGYRLKEYPHLRGVQTKLDI